MNPPEDPRVAKSKAAVLASTAELLAEQGMNGATVDAVAARSGVAKTTIYRHWRDRETLLFEAVLTMAPPCQDRPSGDLQGDLVHLLENLVSALHSSSFGRALPSIIDNAARHDDIASLLERFGEERRSAAYAILRRAVAAGELPEDADVKLAHSLLVGPVFYQCLVGRGGRPTRRQLEHIVARVLAGMRADI
jgi:AcrR family transcriptional regulator